MTITKKEQINQWLLDRNISQEIIDDAGLTFDGERIVIPIKNSAGKHIFNKRRKDPFADDLSSKYLYEKGTTATLYNSHTIVGKRGINVFITEGEFDCLVLQSLGLNAVSSTGGSSTFHIEWIDYLRHNNVYIVYDRDEAGIRGALKVQKMIPFAKIVFLPHDTKGKDVTDYFRTHTLGQFLTLVQNAENWKLPYEPMEVPQKVTEINSILKTLNETADFYLEKQREYVSLGRGTDHITVLFEMIHNRKDYWDRQKESFNKPKLEKNADNIAQARAVPISRFIKFNHAGFSTCLWHNERSASMKYYPERNKVYCYGCNAHKDTIDVVMQMNACSFVDALKLILGNPLQ